MCLSELLFFRLILEESVRLSHFPCVVADEETVAAILAGRQKPIGAAGLQDEGLNHGVARWVGDVAGPIVLENQEVGSL